MTTHLSIVCQYKLYLSGNINESRSSFKASEKVMFVESSPVTI